MHDDTPDPLANRVSVVGQSADEFAGKDWRRMIGALPDDELTRAVTAQIHAAREADRAAARGDRPQEPAA